MKKNIFAASVAVILSAFNAAQVDPSAWNLTAAVLFAGIAAAFLLSSHRPAAE